LLEILKAGAGQGIGQGLVGIAGKVLAPLKGPASRAGGQVIKVLTGVQEKEGAQALADPAILAGFKSAEKVGDDIAAWAKKRKILSGSAGWRAVFKDELVSGATLRKAIDLVAKKGNKMTAQQALAARQLLGKAISKTGRQSIPEAAVNLRRIIELQAVADDVLAKKAPGYAPLANQYRRAAVREAFNSLMPVNIGRGASVVRGLVAGGAGLGVDPAAGIMTLAAMSPIVARLGITLGAGAGKLGAEAGKAAIRSAIQAKEARRR